MNIAKIATREEVELSLSIMSYGLDTVRSALTEVKENISELLTNKNVPLETRWNFFIKYGDLIGNEGGWIQHFKVEKKLPDGEISWYDDFYKERYETIIMVDIIESIYDKIADDKRSKGSNRQSGWNEELVDEFKEEILAENLYSFILAW